MNWTVRESAVTSGPYNICSEIRGYSVWYRSEDKFGVLKREIPTLAKAKSYCEAHLLEDLDAVAVK